MILFYIGIFVVSFFAGVFVARKVFLWALREDPEGILNALHQYVNNSHHKDDYDDDFIREMKIQFDEYENRWRAFNSDTGVFVSQGTSKIDAVRAAADRFPDTKFIYD